MEINGGRTFIIDGQFTLIFQGFIHYLLSHPDGKEQNENTPVHDFVNEKVKIILASKTKT